MSEATQLAQTAQFAPAHGRVLILAPQPFYDNRGTPIAVRLVIEALSELGYEIDLVTLPFGSDIDVPGLTINRLPNFIRAKSVPIGFSVAKLAFAIAMLLSIVKRLRRHDYVCIHAVEDAALMTALCSRRNHPPMIYDMASSLPEQLKSHGFLRRLPLGRFFEAAERLMLGRASVVVASAGLDSEISRSVQASKRFVWKFPALDVPLETTPEDLRAELDLPKDASILMYTGNFAPYQGTELLLDATRIILEQRPEAVLIMVGAQNDNDAEGLHERVPDKLRDRIHLLPQVPRHTLGRYLAAADILVSPRAYGTNFPLKIFDYFAAGKPIVATEIPAHTSVLDWTLAELTKPNAEAFAAGINRILDNPARARDLAEATLNYANAHLRWPHFVGLIKTLYDHAIADKRTDETSKSAKEALKAADHIGA